jgi:hypothetical protein
MKLGFFFRHIFEEYLNTKFNQNSSSESRVVPSAWTDKRDEDKSRSSQSCERGQTQHYRRRLVQSIAKSVIVFIKGTQRFVTLLSAQKRLVSSFKGPEAVVIFMHVV